MLLQPSDLVGCRYRLSQKQRHPDIPPTDTTYARRRRLALARRQATALLPTHPQRGDKKLFHRVDLGTLDDAEDRWFATLEALAAQATIITDAMLHTTRGGHAFAVPIDALVRRELLGTRGLGLKIVARATGFSWDEQDVDGEASIGLYLAGTPAARAALLSYNGDDCRATAAVRRFLAAGAPGLPSMADFA